MAKWLNRYNMMGLIGQGGMGDVHLAIDDVLGRHVAVKRVNSKLLDHAENHTLLGYFEREAKLAASLQHPNIIQIYEYGRPANESAYIITEFIDGISLEEITCDLGALPTDATVSLLHPIAEALEFAHTQNVIHRDLKPGNVMLSRTGRVVLMDFGLAKSIESFGDGLQSMVIGSPAFMSPEQVTGGQTDVRTDVFSFGLLTFAMATAIFRPIRSPLGSITANHCVGYSKLWRHSPRLFWLNHCRCAHKSNQLIAIPTDTSQICLYAVLVELRVGSDVELMGLFDGLCPNVFVNGGTSNAVAVGLNGAFSALDPFSYLHGTLSPYQHQTK